jgi:hypothetical protein
MSGKSDIERALDGFLADGPERVSDQAFLRALDAIDRTKQRRDLFAPWRISLMSINSRLATMMVVAIVAVGGATYLLGQRNPVGGSGGNPAATNTSTPNPTASAPVAIAPSPVPSIDTSNWAPFTSAIYGFSARNPLTWSQQPATGTSASNPGGDANPDILWSQTGWPDFKGYEIKLPAGTTADKFLQTYTADAVKTACYPLPDMWVTTTIDGHAAHIAYAGCNEHFYFAQATAVIGNRIWFFVLDGPDRSLIVPFLTTVKIDTSKVVD